MEEGGGTGGVALVENEDYYMDNGLMILTALHHLRRGYCCEQGCRHCPYLEVTKRKVLSEADNHQEDE